MIRLLPCLILMMFFIPTANAQEFTDAQKNQIQKMFEEYLLENGSTVIESVEKYQNEQEAQSRKLSEVKAKEFLKSLDGGKDLPMTGNKDGDITLVEFFDYNCGYCGRALEEIVTVLENDKNLKVIFLDMPILSPDSLETSKWSLAAHQQGKYFEFHQAIFDHKGQKNEKVFEKLAKDLGLDVEKLKKDKNSPDIEATLKNNVAKAQEMNIRGTPGFIINGQIFPGYMQAERITEILKEARANNANKG